MRELLSNKTLKGLIDLYEYEIVEIREDKEEVLLYDRQSDEEVIFDREYLVEHFATDCDERYHMDGNELHKRQADEIRSLLDK